MAEIKEDIAAYDALRKDLELAQMGKWVLIHDRKLVSTYGSFGEAAAEAALRFGRGPYLIRQVGAESVTLPASVMFRPTYGRP